MTLKKKKKPSPVLDAELHSSQYGWPLFFGWQSQDPDFKLWRNLFQATASGFLANEMGPLAWWLWSLPLGLSQGETADGSAWILLSFSFHLLSQIPFWCQETPPFFHKANTALPKNQNEFLHEPWGTPIRISFHCPRLSWKHKNRRVFWQQQSSPSISYPTCREDRN